MKGKVVWDAAEAVGGPGLRQSFNYVKVTGFTMKAVLSRRLDKSDLCF